MVPNRNLYLEFRVRSLEQPLFLLKVKIAFDRYGKGDEMHEIIESELYLDINGTTLVKVTSVVEEGRDIVNGTVIMN